MSDPGTWVGGQHVDLRGTTAESTTYPACSSCSTGPPHTKMHMHAHGAPAAASRAATAPAPGQPQPTLTFPLFSKHACPCNRAALAHTHIPIVLRAQPGAQRPDVLLAAALEARVEPVVLRRLVLVLLNLFLARLAKVLERLLLRQAAAGWAAVVHVCVHMCICVCVCMCVRVPVSVCVCVHVHVRVFADMHAHARGNQQSRLHISAPLSLPPT